MPYLSGALYAVATFLMIDAGANLTTVGHNAPLEFLLAVSALFVGATIHLIATIRNDNR